MFQDKHWRFPHRTCSFMVAKPSKKSSITRLVYFDSGYDLRWNFVSLFYLIKSKKKMIQILTWLVLIVVLNKNFPKLASVFIPIKNFVQRSKRFLLCPAPGTWYSRAGSEMFKLTRPANAWCSKKAVAIISRPNVSI